MRQGNRRVAGELRAVRTYTAVAKGSSEQAAQAQPMATTLAIRAVSNALREVLESARAGTTFAAMPVQIAQTVDFAAPPAEGVTVYLYRVSIHAGVRHATPRPTRDGGRRKPSLPLDLHYLVTPWARTAPRQQEILGWILRTFEDQPILPNSVLNREGPVFHDGEAVDVVAQPLTPVELVAVWEFNKSAMQPSMTYVARMVLLDSEIAVQDGAAITSRTVQVRP